MFSTDGFGLYASGWYFNPFFGMYTFVPGMDLNWFGPYGFPFFSPYNVYMAYMPGYLYYPYFGGYGYPYGGGYSGVYNTLNYKSVPVPTRGGGGVVGHGGYNSSSASGRGSSVGWSSGSLGSTSSVGSVSAASHGGGGAAGGGGGGHH